MSKLTGIIPDQIDGEKLATLLAGGSDTDSTRQRPIVAEISISSRSLCSWLSGLELYPKVYWRSRDGEFELAGGGDLLGGTQDPSALVDLKHIQRLLADSNSQSLMAFVFNSFDKDRVVDSRWQEFSNSVAVIPKLSILRMGNSTKAVLATMLSSKSTEEELRTEFARLRESLDATCDDGVTELRVLGRRDYPDKNQWMHSVGSAVESIAAGHLDKVVLARRSDIELVAPIDGPGLLSRLSASSPQSYNLMYAPNASCAYICLSPERLFRIEDRQLNTEAVAGTVSRGENGAHDASLEEQLRSSDKDRSEHRFVIDGLIEALKPLCVDMEVSSHASVMKLSTIQHLVTRITAELNDGVSESEILARVHPTAAVCGAPRDASRQTLTELEKFDRGWYAGAHGILSAEFSEFAVGIRSGVLRENMLSLFVGAGIVAQSDPASEWQELEDKLQSVIRALVEAKI